MSLSRFFACALAIAIGMSAATWCCLASADQPIDFSRQILPILTDKCFRCHGPDEETIEAGLRLDSREHALKELESGNRAIVPGEPAASELLARVSEPDDDLRMPPADAGMRLDQQQIALLRRWINEGANYDRHWAYVPPSMPPLPTDLSNPQWVRNPIDAFVLSRLEAAGLEPSPEADRYALIRRLSLDLTGLPPSVEEVDAFVNDTSATAYEDLVERLLRSAGYGERWARVWLDLARYADSAGYAQDPPRTIWRYRDWVIQAINDNMPFDQFTVEQIAGDMLPEPSDDQLIATAFHRNTMTNSEGGTDDEEFRTAAVVDRVNTTMQVWMGMTIGCAQCHSHKYDPISQEEYFRFYAILNNTEDSDKGDERPTLVTLLPEQVKQKEAIQRQIDELEAEIAAKAKERKPETVELAGDLKTRYVRVELPGKNVFLSLAEVQAFAGQTNVALAGKASQISTGFDGPPQLAIDGNTDGHYFDAKSTTHTAQGDDPWWQVDLGKSHQLDRVVIWNRTDSGNHARLANFRVIGLDEQRRPIWLKAIGPAPNPSVAQELPKTAKELSDKELAAIAEYRTATDAPELAAEKKRLQTLKDQLAGIKGVPTPIMRELPPDRRRQTHIQIRGDFLAKGKQVVPGVPSAFHPLPEDADADRLALARWLVSNDNPLTARVLVNRYWEQLFGIGLVETSEDFGLQGEYPSHPKLLDYLAVSLMESGWNTKELVRLIVTSATYRQTSRVSDGLQDLDPANRLLARGPRFRLSAEMIRDQALAVSGLLSRKMYGPSVRPPRPNLGLRAAFGGSTDWTTSDGEDRYRRGLYTSWRRTTPYPSMTTFDAPSREFCTIRRIRTNTPLQALVTLNDPVYVEAAQALARRTVREGGDTAESRAQYGFRLCLARPPQADELGRIVQLFERLKARFEQEPEKATKLATDPLGALPQGMDAAELAAWTVVGNVLMNLDEFIAKR